MPEKEQNISSPPHPAAEEHASSPATLLSKRKFSPRVAILIGAIVLLGLTGVIYAWMMGNSKKQEVATGKTYKIGILSGLDFFLSSSEAFKKEMTKLGYIEGENVEYIFEQSNIEEEKEDPTPQANKPPYPESLTTHKAHTLEEVELLRELKNQC